MKFYTVNVKTVGRLAQMLAVLKRQADGDQRPENAWIHLHWSEPMPLIQIIPDVPGDLRQRKNRERPATLAASCASLRGTR